jgi:hypothetical protein
VRISQLKRKVKKDILGFVKEFKFKVRALIIEE